MTQRLRIPRKVWLLAAWDYDGKVHREYFETKKAAMVAREGALESTDYASVTFPIGPFRLTMGERTTSAKASDSAKGG